jgi:hypothetical protein
MDKLIVTGVRPIGVQGPQGAQGNPGAQWGQIVDVTTFADEERVSWMKVYRCRYCNCRLELSYIRCAGCGAPT